MKGLAARADSCVGMGFDRPWLDFVSVARQRGLTTCDAPTVLDARVERSWTPV
jgi:hypothetical protein